MRERPYDTLCSLAIVALVGTGSTHCVSRGGSTQSRSPAADAAKSVVVPSTFEVHGHRGARGRYPENSTDGFVAAFRDGADVIETDLLLTKDGALIIHHNYEPNPDTTRDESGRWLDAPGAPFVSMTLAETGRFDIGRLRPGSDYGRRFPLQQGRDGVRIPTLDAALDAVERGSGGRARWNLEIKIATEHPERTAPPDAVAEATLRKVREHGLEARIMVQSFDWRAVRRVQALAPNVPTGCLTSPDTVRQTANGPSPFNAGLDVANFGGSVARLVHAAGCKYWTPEHTSISQSDVQEAHRLGLRVVPWTVNEPADLRRAVELCVDGVITDYPDRVGRR